MGDRFHYYILARRKIIYSTRSVFSVSGVPKHTFVSRDNLYEKVQNYLEHPDGVLLFLGYSKSGKTVFRKKYIEKSKYNVLTFKPNNETKIDDLYADISVKANIKIKSEVSSVNKKAKSVGADYGLMNKLIGKFIHKKEDLNEESVSIVENITTPNIDVNFLCDNLERHKTIIVIEDYHLVSEKFNNKLSNDLKHFLDENIFFLLIGVPSSPNRALRNNPDLSGRTRFIMFDYLEDDDVRKIIGKGCRLLNVNFSEDVVSKIIECSFKNAYLVQSICQNIFLSNGIKETLKKYIVISDCHQVDLACQDIASELDNDYRSICEKIRLGFKEQTDKTINQYDEIIKSIKYFELDRLEKGVYDKEVFEFSWNNLIENNPEVDSSKKPEIRSQISHAFVKINDLLSARGIKPIFHVHDDKLYINDLVFKFYLDWSSGHHCNEKKSQQLELL